MGSLWGAARGLGCDHTCGWGGGCPHQGGVLPLVLGPARCREGAHQGLQAFAPLFHQTPPKQKVQRSLGCQTACSPPKSLRAIPGAGLPGPAAPRGPLAPEHVSVVSCLCFTAAFCAWCLRGATRLCLGLATAACNCSSSQTSVSLPQGWGWGSLGNAAGVVCLVVCSRNVGQTVKFFSPLVK